MQHCPPDILALVRRPDVRHSCWLVQSSCSALRSVTGGMVAILSLVYLTMPGGLVQCYLLMRCGRAATTARIGASQTISDHILTACLVLAWPSPWSIMLPKLLTAPVWLLSMRQAMPWRPTQVRNHIPARALLGQAFAILASEIMVAVRTQADKLIVAALSGGAGAWHLFFRIQCRNWPSVFDDHRIRDFVFPDDMCRTQIPPSDARLIRNCCWRRPRGCVPLVVTPILACAYLCPARFRRALGRCDFAGRNAVSCRHSPWR